MNSPLSAATEPASLSFADLYRLTLSGPMGAESPVAAPPPQAEAYIFTVAASGPQAGRPQGAQEFSPALSVGALPEPQRWLLLLSGLAAAGWVARRRLGYSL